jgi:putative membrane protein
MRKIAHLLSGFFLILVFVASIGFSFFNSTPVALSFGNWQIPAQPVSVWIIGAFVSGGLIGLLLGLGFIRNLKSKAELRRLTKALAAAQKEVNQLRALTLKDV